MSSRGHPRPAAAVLISPLSRSSSVGQAGQEGGDEAVGVRVNPCALGRLGPGEDAGLGCVDERQRGGADDHVVNDGGIDRRSDAGVAQPLPGGPCRVVQGADVALDHPAQALAVLGGFVDHDLAELGAGGSEADEPSHRVGECRCEEVVDRRGPQRLLRSEVVVDLRLLGVDPLGDRACRGTVETLGAELDKHRVEQPLADVLSCPTRLCDHPMIWESCRWRPSHSHRPCVFGTARRTDGPAMSIVYYVPTDGDEPLVSTMRDRAKPKAVARNGKVSLCVLDERWPFSYLQVYCDAVVDEDPDLVVDVMMAVGGRISGGTLPEEARPVVAAMAEQEGRGVLPR